MNPCLRVVERCREFFYKGNRDVITCPKGSGDREFCIKFHPKGTVSAMAPARTRPSAGRHKRNKSFFQSTAGQDTRPEIITGRGRAAERGENSDTDGRESSSKVGAGQQRGDTLCWRNEELGYR